MPRWMRVTRGMITAGLTFGAVVGTVGALAGTSLWLFDQITGRELLGIVAKASVVASLVGVAFSGVLAIVARGRTFEKLSLPRIAALGAVGGATYFALISVTAYRVWSVRDAIGNLALLSLMGAGAATATMLLARRARSGSDAGSGPTTGTDHGVGDLDRDLDPIKISDPVIGDSLIGDPVIGAHSRPSRQR